MLLPFLRRSQPTVADNIAAKLVAPRTHLPRQRPLSPAHAAMLALCLLSGLGVLYVVALVLVAGWHFLGWMLWS